tara:strand:+ start:187 stop:414 length:228 start_codon:yes stop_codon:yes gene_type:complete
MAKIISTKGLNKALSVATTYSESQKVFEETERELLQKYSDVANAADDFDMLTLRGRALMHQASGECARRNVEEKS